MSMAVFKMSGWVVGAALAVGMALPAAAQKVEGPKVTWNFNMYGPKRAATWGQEELARQLSDATGGNFTMTIHYGEVLGPPREALDGLSIGAFEMAIVGSGFTPGKIPVIEGSALPFLPTPTIYHATEVREALFFHPSGLADIARWGAVTIMQVPLAINEFMGKGKPPLTLAEWKGKRFRALGGDARALQLVGASGVNIPAPEIYGGVERGMLDGMSTAPYAFVSFRLHEISTWYTTNMGLSSASFLLPASKKSYDALPPQYQKLLHDLSPGVMRKWIEVFNADDNKAIELFKAKGLMPIAYPAAELEKLRSSVRPIWDEWIATVNKQGYNGAELLDVMIKAANATKVPG
ncbi:MAG: TRAP transporter substrate-binding protein DctP [Alphaproteobacteria bacterium]